MELWLNQTELQYATPFNHSSLVGLNYQLMLLVPCSVFHSSISHEFGCAMANWSDASTADKAYLWRNSDSGSWRMCKIICVYISIFYIYLKTHIWYIYICIHSIYVFYLPNILYHTSRFMFSTRFKRYPNRTQFSCRPRPTPAKPRSPEDTRCLGQSRCCICTHTHDVCVYGCFHFQKYWYPKMDGL